MVPGVSDVRLLVKLPVPDPSIVLGLSVIGFSFSHQQTPLAVTSAPPSSVTFPPDEAVVRVISDTPVVVREGRVGSFLQEKQIIVSPIKSMTISDIRISRFMIFIFNSPEVIFIKVKLIKS